MSNPGSFGIPNRQLDIGQGKTDDGKPPVNVRLSDIWYSFFVRIAQLTAERPIAPVTVGASPFSYTATTIGHMLITGGTISSRVLNRGGITANFTGELVPMAAEDILILTYTVAPTLKFIPSARA